MNDIILAIEEAGDINLTILDDGEINLFLQEDAGEIGLILSENGEINLSIEEPEENINISIIEGGDINLSIKEDSEIILKLDGNVGDTIWGNILGTLSNQADLQTALDLKFNTADFNSSFDTQLATKDTDDLSEGVTNLYYTEVRVSNNVDVAANTTARHDAITLAGTPNYITLLGQVLTRNQIDLTTDVTGVLPDANVANNITLDNITQITNRSHTNLSDIGSNTHSQIDSHISNITTNPHQVDKTDVGLGNVDNTSDANKPVSTATQTALDLKINLTEKAANNGVATLDAGGKIPATQLPSTVMEFKGNWNASTNTPTLADGTGDSGDVWLVSVAGTQNLGSGNITFAVGDWVVYNGTIWEKSINSNAVVSVNTQTGVVVLDSDDISEGVTNLYLTGNEFQKNVDDMDDITNGATYVKTTNDYTTTEKNKLSGVEALAEVNNISDVNATDLTDAGDSSLHYHSADRARANHTGTQTASTISDFDTEVSNNTDVAANTAARHAESHTIASHSDTTATGAELNTLTDGSDTALHTHSTLQPTGAMTMYGATAAPTGWLLCDGVAISRTTYSDLFGVLGTTYGVGDGSTTFNVPDMRGIFPRGAGVNGTLSDANGTGFTGVLGTYQNDRFQGHKHKMWNRTADAGDPSAGENFSFADVRKGQYGVQAFWNSYSITSDTTSGPVRSGTETSPANLGVNFIIKY